MRTRTARNLVIAGLLALAMATAASAAPPTNGPPASAPPASTNPRASLDDARRTVGRSPIGPGILDVLGPRAADALAPTSGLVGALVALPKGKRAEELGLDPVAPGIGRLRAAPSAISSWAGAHPGLHIEIAPPLHMMMDRVNDAVFAATARATRGVDGRGVTIGVADTGVDVTHPDLRDASGKSRIAWLLDLSIAPDRLSRFPALEQQFGVRDADGNIVKGKVFDNEDINAALESIRSGACNITDSLCAPTDDVGHGTHVAGIAAGSASSSSAGKGRYVGVAPAADIVFVRITRTKSEGIENDDLLRAVQFMFDRADAEKRPMVVNLSLGAEFGPHDGTLLWEQVIASYVGPEHPGRAVVAAAGNSGSVVETPLHQSVRVSSSETMKVPIRTSGADAGAVQLWITMRAGANLKVGLEGPDGTWISPVEDGRQQGKNTAQYNAGVIHGSSLEGSPIPDGSRGAVIVWQGQWPSGTYYVTFEGEGMAELYMQSFGDASLSGNRPVYFANGVRQGTITLPATHPSIIAVGCTVNRPRWTSIGGASLGLYAPKLDEAGGRAYQRRFEDDPLSRDVEAGEVCWFSSAGPTATGVPKPEIAAPGALVIAAMSRDAIPGSPGSVFTNSGCPLTKSGKSDKRCLQIDEGHGIAIGTSMSAPVVSGVVAMLLQKDPTLTQDKIVALLQAGAHRFRGAAPFDDQSGPGEVDAMGALDALDQAQNPTLQLPSFDRSWLTLSTDYVPADGSTPVTSIVELRTADGEHRADFFDKDRLRALVLVSGKAIEPAPELIRRGPGVYFFVWTPPPGLGGQIATFGTTFDGADIVARKLIPIATDRWTAAYPSRAGGSGCSAAPIAASSAPRDTTLLACTGVGLAALLARVTRRRGSRANREAPTSVPSRRRDRTGTPDRRR